MDDGVKDVRWTGRIGEKAFDLLCSKAKITCNKVAEDDYGWDFIVQFPERPSAVLMHDEREAGPAALVQVKTTAGAIRNWSITLQNALHLIRSPLPAFIVVYVLEEDGSETIYGVHLWKREIGRVLLAAREADRDGITRLNHSSITFPFGEENRRADVLAWIRSEVEAVGSDYTEQKNLLRNTIGYGPVRDTMHLSGPSVTEDRLMDLQLGLVDGIDVENITVTSKRFGIEARKPRLTFQGVRLSMTPTGSDGKLRLRTQDGESLIVPAKIYHARSPVSKRYKVRVTAGCFDLLCDPKGRITIDAVLPRDRVTSLADIDLFAFLQTAAADDLVSLSLVDASGTIDLGFLRTNVSERDRASWVQTRHNLAALQAIATYEGATPLEMSIASMSPVFGPLVMLDALSCARAVRIDFVPVETTGRKFDHHLGYGSAVLDGRVIGLVASRPVVSDDYEGERRLVYLGPARILSAVHGGDARDLRERYFDALERLSVEQHILATGDMMHFLDGAGGPLIVDQPDDRDVPSLDATKLIANGNRA